MQHTHIDKRIVFISSACVRYTICASILFANAQTIFAVYSVSSFPLGSHAYLSGSVTGAAGVVVVVVDVVVVDVEPLFCRLIRSISSSDI